MSEEGIERTADEGEQISPSGGDGPTIREAIQARLMRNPAMLRFIRLAAAHGLLAGRADRRGQMGDKGVTGLSRAELLVARAKWLGQPLPHLDELVEHTDEEEM